MSLNTKLRRQSLTSRSVSALRSLAAATILGLTALAGTPAAIAQPAAPAPVSTPEGGAAIWKAALDGKFDTVVSLSEQLAAGVDGRELTRLRQRVEQVKASIAFREQERTANMERVGKQIDELVDSAKSAVEISKALLRATELHMLAIDKQGLLKTDRIANLIRKGDAAAHKAETDGDWLMAGELFGRLNLLLEETQTYKADVRRLSDRLGMIRMYAPERLYELRNIRRQQDGLPALPPFNRTGEDYTSRLSGVNEAIVLRAIGFATESHVERVPVQKLIQGGLEAIKVFCTTRDLAAIFPGLADATARDALIAHINGELTRFAAADAPGGPFVVQSVLNDLLAKNKSTINIPDEAILHEFGNGCFDRLDEFSQIVWPDELARFKRMTEGSFVGVGIQIQLDEESQMIKVVSPLEGTPAQKAGIRSGDLLKKINEKSAIGMSLDQAVEQITGGSGSLVKILIERAGEDVAYELKRARIKLPTVKGWTRSGPGEMDWNWFIDENSQIGYMRVSNFSDTTTADLKRAIGQMKRTGLKGVILDLRFNPGGLLDQAVSVGNLFIDEGPIVWTQGSGPRKQIENAESGRASLRSIPTIVMINETSASASEIVSGAVRFYADKGEVPAVVLGNRSYGKGSVQNVAPLSSQAQMKLTTAYYYLPSGVCIHRRPGASTWGVEPHIKVEMLPKQQNDSIVLRSDADLTADAERPKPAKRRDGEMPVDDTRNGPPDANRLLAENIDLQLQTALLVLEARLAGSAQASAAPTKR